MVLGRCDKGMTEADRRQRSGMDHVAFCLAPAHYEAVPERCRSGGLEIPRAAFNSGAWGQGHAAYFLDPGGNHIEIKHYGGAGEPAE